MLKNKNPRSKIYSQLLYWLPAILYMILIFILSSFPAPEPLKQVPIIFKIKIVHIIEYGILSVLIAFGLINTTNCPPKTIFILAVALTFIYGLSDEIHQAFVINRTCKISDAVSNLFGAILFQTFFLIYISSQKLRTAKKVYSPT